MITTRSNTSQSVREYVRLFNDMFPDNHRVNQKAFALNIPDRDLTLDEVQTVSSADLRCGISIDGVNDIVRAVREANKRVGAVHLTISHAVRGNTGPVSRHHFGLAVDFQAPGLTTHMAVNHFKKVIGELKSMGFRWNMAYIRIPSPAGIKNALLHVDLHLGGEPQGRRLFGGVKP